MRKMLCIIVLLVCCGSMAYGDSLPRRGFFGAALAERNNAVVIQTVYAGSAAQAARLMPGDIIASLDGQPVTTVPDFLTRIRRPAGTQAQMVIVRGGQSMPVTVVLAEYPKETDPSTQTLYGSVSVDGDLHRTLLTVPNAPKGRRPAILLIGGIGCFSIDTANAQDAYRLLAHDLSARGFVTMRVEKSGVGDSQGPPCDTVDFTHESLGYEMGLRALFHDPHVDPKRIYLFGHSIGSIIAPRLAAQQPVAGIIVAEAVDSSWFEYELANNRRQLVLDGVATDAIDPQQQLKEDCMHRLLIEKQGAATIVHDRPDCAGDISYPASAAYLQQVAALNIEGAWTTLDVPVLAIYGDADFVTDVEDHEHIVDTVNAAHAGQGQLDIIKGMDHNLWVFPSPAAAFANYKKGLPGQYDAQLSEDIVRWLCAREQCPARS